MSRETSADGYSILKENLDQLRCLGQELSKLTSEISHEGHYWTLLKLVFLKLYLEKVYTPIISKRYQKMFYVDLFAGTGINFYKIRNQRVYFPGSPVIAWAYACRKFDKLFLVESDKEKAESLRKVMSSLAPESCYKIIKGEAERVYKDILEEILGHRGAHFLCFIDPCGYVTLTWNMLRDLMSSPVRGDLIILFQVGYIAMAIGRLGKENDERAKRRGIYKSLTRVFGDEDWYKKITSINREIKNSDHLS